MENQKARCAGKEKTKKYYHIIRNFYVKYRYFILNGGVKMITLREITSENYEECLALKVRDDQRDFVASNVKSLADAWVFYTVARPFAIYNDDIMVGFLMVDTDPNLVGSNELCFLWRFMIDAKYQGCGYGKGAMQEVINYVKSNFNPKTFETSTTPGNDAAENLYRSFGFIPNGKYIGDEKVLVLNLRNE
jgi:diamine N-acetyltransferase